MRSFREFVDDAETVEELEEGTLRNLGAAVLFSRVVSLSRKINCSNAARYKKLDLTASQSTHLAALGLAVE